MDPIVHCPACQKGLQVTVELAGQIAQCPGCRHQFVIPAAAAAGVSAEPLPPPPSVPAPAPAPTPAPAPIPVSRSLVPRSRDDEDDEEMYDDDGMPRHRSIRAHYEPGRAGLVLTFGILGLVFVLMGVVLYGIPALLTLIFGPLAWVMGGREIAAIREGRHDPTGEGMVQTGRVLGIVATVLALCLLLLVGLCVGFFVFIIAAGGG